MNCEKSLDYPAIVKCNSKVSITFGITCVAAVIITDYYQTIEFHSCLSHWTWTARLLLKWISSLSEKKNFISCQGTAKLLKSWTWHIFRAKASVYDGGDKIRFHGNYEIQFRLTNIFFYIYRFSSSSRICEGKCVNCQLQYRLFTSIRTSWRVNKWLLFGHIFFPILLCLRMQSYPTRVLSDESKKPSYQWSTPLSVWKAFRGSSLSPRFVTTEDTGNNTKMRVLIFFFLPRSQKISHFVHTSKIVFPIACCKATFFSRIRPGGPEKQASHLLLMYVVVECLPLSSRCLKFCQHKFTPDEHWLQNTYGWNSRLLPLGKDS